MRPLARIETQQLRGRGSRAEWHQVAGWVEATAKIGLVHQYSHAASGFHTRNHRFDEIQAGGIIRFSHRQCGRHVGGRGVTTHGQVRIGKIQRIGHRAINQRGIGGGSFFAVIQNRRQGVAALLARLGAKHRNQRLVGPANGDTEPVKNALARGLNHITRER